MSSVRYTRLVAITMALSVAFVSGWYVFRAAAQPPTQLYTLGLERDTCNRTGKEEAAGGQSQPIGVVLRGFYSQEPVYLSVTFPDGRVFSVIPAALMPVNTADGLDGLIDRPPNPAYTIQASVGGDFYQMLMPTVKWPYGCYTLNALGVTSGNRAMGFYVIRSRNDLPINPGQADLQAVAKQTQRARGPQGTTVDLFGRGFLAAEQIAVTLQQPNGTLLELPSATTSLIGSFQTSLDMTSSFQTGQYTFIASGASSSVSQTFTLEAAPVEAKGWGRLRIARPALDEIRQETEIEVQGQQFSPGEPVTLSAVLPSGAIRDLGTVAADGNGEFAGIVVLDRLFPLGRYRLIARGEVSGFVTTLSEQAEGFRLLAGSQQVTEAVLAPAGPQPQPTLAPTPAATAVPEGKGGAEVVPSVLPDTSESPPATTPAEPAPEATPAEPSF